MLRKCHMSDCNIQVRMHACYKYIVIVQISSLKRVKRELEAKIEELEDELDEVTVRSESLEQVC